MVSYDLAFLVPLPILRLLRVATIVKSLWALAVAGSISIAALSFWRIFGVEVSHLDCYYNCNSSVVPLNLDYTISIATFAVLLLSLVAYICQKWELARNSPMNEAK
jgi:hypothetical protein